MASRSQILGALTKQRLLNIAWKFDFTGLSALRKADIVSTLARKRSILMEEVLELLKRDELKAICQELGLDDSGKKKAPLIERITKASGCRKPKKQKEPSFLSKSKDKRSAEETKDTHQTPFFSKAQHLEEIEPGDTDKDGGDFGISDFENEDDGHYVEMTPDLVLRKTTTPAIQVFIDYLPDTEPQDWQPTVRKFTKEWVESKDFEKEGTIWFWGSNAVYQQNGVNEIAWAEFAVPFGFGSGFFDFLLRRLKRLWGSAVKISSYVVVNISEGWSVLCHVKDGKVWQQIDPITWIEFTS